MERTPRKDKSWQREATWLGYNNSYTKNIVRTGLKALKLLATLTFDMELVIVTNELKRLLEKRIAEAEREQQKIDQRKFH